MRKSWWKRRSSAPLRCRLQLCERLGQSVVLWSAGFWRCLKPELQVLRSAQREQWEHIVAPRRIWHESLNAYIRRRHRLVNTIRLESNTRTWSALAVEQKFLWAGHLARMDATRLKARAFERRGNVWRQEQSISGLGQLHGRRVRIHRWEQQIEDSLGVDWIRLTRDREQWKAISRREAARIDERYFPSRSARGEEQAAVTYHARNVPAIVVLDTNVVSPAPPPSSVASAPSPPMSRQHPHPQDMAYGSMVPTTPPD